MDTNLAQPELKERIQTQGLELVLIGVVAFIVIIGLTLGTYKVFIMDRVKGSPEFKTAEFFALHSADIKSRLNSSDLKLKLEDIQVTEYENYGICEIFFYLYPQDKTTHTLSVGLVKVADFWIVYNAQLDEDEKPGKEAALVSPYQKILTFLEHLDYQELEMAEGVLDILDEEIPQQVLKDDLEAKLLVAEGSYAEAETLLKKVRDHVEYASLAVQQDLALLYYDQEDYRQAALILDLLVRSYESRQQDAADSDLSLFQGLPKDPFIASMDPENVMAAASNLFSLVYLRLGEYEKGLDWSKKAITQAKKIKSSVLRSNSVFLKALHLYSLKRFDEAEKEFNNVINDIDNPNLSEKALAYFYKADIADRLGRDTDSLDYYEIAVNLEPLNAQIRRGAIEYLMRRSYAGDLEIALGMALRGMDYGADKRSFEKLAARLYKRLGMTNQTQIMD